MTIYSQKTLLGQTGGGLLKTAQVIESMAEGVFHVWIKDRDGNEYIAMTTDEGNMALMGYDGLRYIVSMSQSAKDKLAALEDEAGNKMQAAVDAENAWVHEL